MIINVDDEYRISSDSHQWIVQRKKSYKDKETGKLVDSWESVSYYPRLEDAVNGLYDRQLRACDASELSECIAEARKIAKRLETALNPSFTVNMRKIGGER